MSSTLTLVRALLVLSFVASSQLASAQTADDLIEKSLAAMGGRTAFGRIRARIATGSITLQTPAGEIPGTVEVTNAAPNKARTVIKADLSSLGAGQLVIDQRFDGTNGYILDSLQGNREMTGDQLTASRNNSFPHPYLTYKERGTSVKVAGQEKVGANDAIVLELEPSTGPTVKNYIDAGTFLPLKSVAKINVPQFGELEQTTEFGDYRDVDGIKMPFKLTVSSSVQGFVITLSKVEHNGKVDEAQFAKPQ